MQTDTLIIGCGIAGATTALELSRDRERQVVLITAETAPTESNSWYAQGGIVGLGEDDTPELLIEDVLRAGAGLSWEPASMLQVPSLMTLYQSPPPSPEMLN